MSDGNKEDDILRDHHKKHAIRVMQAVQLEKQANSTKSIFSKKALQLILKLEEFDWSESAVRQQQKM